MSIVSLNVGKPAHVNYQNKEIYTAIHKNPTTEPVYLSSVNFEGDAQGDLVHHGGVNKAVCVYPAEHYPHWEQVLGCKLHYGAFGENLTVLGMTEEEVRIGDVYRLGEAVVQVSQPRQPCFKLSMKHQAPDLVIHVQKTGYTGYYFRVLQEGMVSPASELTCLNRHPQGVTVAFVNRIKYSNKSDTEGIRSILAVDALSSEWREAFAARLAVLGKFAAEAGTESGAGKND